jgi:uncharacterized protein (DUF1501 family)
MSLKRRDLLKSTLALPGLAAVSFKANSQPAPMGDILVCIFQRGGVDGLNMVIPHGDGNYYDWRPNLAIAPPGAENGAIDLDGFFGLHPAMSPLEAIYNSGDLALIHATGSPHDTHSHFDAQDFMERAFLQKGTVFSGWIGRHLETRTSGVPFQAIGIAGTAQKSLTGEGTVVPVAMADITNFGLASTDPNFAPALEVLYGGGAFLDQQAQQALSAAELLATINPAQYPPENGAEYPDSEFGQALFQAGQLIKAEALGVEAICVDTGGWDHHNQQAPALNGLLADLSAALLAFYTDMGTRMANITVITQSEFGRRVYENASAGTDHGHGNAMLVLGGGVNGGRVYADWPGLAQQQLYGNGDLEVTLDWRTVLGELLSKRLLNDDLATVFPDYAMPEFQGVFATGS